MVRTVADQRAAESGCYYDPTAAARVPRFFRTFLRHSKGAFAGKAFELLPYQNDNLIAPLFGWMRPDGTRRFRRAYVEWPKKQGKSTIASGLGLHLLIGDGEPGAEVYSTASTKDQANIVHREAVNMVDASPALGDYLRLNRATKEIHLDRSRSFYKAIAAEARASEGLNAHAIIKDELHAWHGQAGRTFYDALKFAGAARRQPMDFQITTAGDDVTSICYEQHLYAKGILSGAIEDDDRFFAYISAAEPTDDFDNPAVWRKANPSIGVTMSERDFAADLREAKKSPNSWSAFLRYRFNVWQSGGRSAVTPADWSACSAKFAEEDMFGQPCWAALDLSRARDFTAMVLLFKLANGRYRVMAWFWLPEATVAAPNTLETIKAWTRDRHISATSGNVTDYRQVEDDIVGILTRFRPVELAFDPYFAEEVTQRIADRTGIERVAFPQTSANYAAPCAEFERIVVGKLIEHDCNPVLSWMIGNLCWSETGGTKRPAKVTPDSPRKIDGAVAAIMALGRAIVAQDCTPEISFV